MAPTKKTQRKSTGGRPPRRSPKKTPDQIPKMKELHNIECAVDDWLDGNLTFGDWGGKVRYSGDTKSWSVRIDFTQAIKNLRAQLSEKLGEGRVCLRASLYTSSIAFDEPKAKNQSSVHQREEEEEAENEGPAK